MRSVKVSRLFLFGFMLISHVLMHTGESKQDVETRDRARAAAAAAAPAPAPAPAAGNLPMPDELRAMIAHPETVHRVILLPEQEKLLALTARWKYSAILWKALSAPTQRFFTESSSEELRQQARVLFFRQLLNVLTEVRNRAAVAFLTHSHRANSVDDIIKRAADAITLQIEGGPETKGRKEIEGLKKLVTLENQDPLGTFLDALMKKITAAASKKLTHTAMLYRLSTMLGAASHNAREKDLLYQLIAKPIDDAYAQLETLAAKQLSFFSQYVRATGYGWYIAKLWLTNTYPWNKASLLELAHQHNVTIDNYIVQKMQESFKKSYDEPYGIVAQGYLTQLFDHIKVRDASLADALIAIVAAAKREQETRKEQELFSQPLAKQPATLLLNHCMDTVIHFGPQYAYEKLLIMEDDGVLRPYLQRKTLNPTVYVKSSPEITASLLTEPTKILIKIAASNTGTPTVKNFQEKRKAIATLQGVFDQALAADNNDALSHLLTLVKTPFDATGTSIARVDGVKQELKQVLKGGYEALKKLRGSRPWLRTSEPRGGWLRAWHKATEHWYAGKIEDIQ